jgi:hypothetical protein
MAVTKTKDPFYNFLMKSADEIHQRAWVEINKYPNTPYQQIPEWREAKAQELLIGAVIREYEAIHGKPPEV